MFMTPWVQRLLIANVAMYFIPRTSVLYGLLRFDPGQIVQHPWSLVTYMFLHAGFGHIALNMLVLAFFGPRLEGRLGGRDFLWLYFLSGIGGAVLSMIFQLVFQQYAAVVGASGAIYGVVLGFAYFWPREKILLWFVLPVDAWVLATLAVFVSLWSGLSGGGGNVAHFAHLGGLGVAYAFLRIRDVRSVVRKKRWLEGGESDRATAKPKVRGSKQVLARWRGIERDRLHELNREEVDTLLEKITASGEGSLTPAERSFLDRMADRYSKGSGGE